MNFMKSFNDYFLQNSDILRSQLRIILLQLTSLNDRGYWGIMEHFFFMAPQTNIQYKFETSLCDTGQATGHPLKVIC